RGAGAAHAVLPGARCLRALTSPGRGARTRARRAAGRWTRGGVPCAARTAVDVRARCPVRAQPGNGLASRGRAPRVSSPHGAGGGAWSTPARRSATDWPPGDADPHLRIIRGGATDPRNVEASPVAKTKHRARVSGNPAKRGSAIAPPPKPVTLADWIGAARLRTLPLAITPVLIGTGAAILVGDLFHWVIALTCLVVAVSLQIGVNFANDYSDGVRGTDDHRVGPARLTASRRVK